jgi:glycerate kinase
MPLLLASPDKFRGTLTGRQAAAAMVAAGAAAGWEAEACPISDGGEGFLECFDGRRRPARVDGPLGRPVDAAWLALEDHDRTGVVEMATASGLSLAGGAEGNDPLLASTIGTGQLIASAVADGARRILLGVGGSATTDGGLGAVTALGRGARLAGVDLVVACDVTTRFVDAAARFAPQKGATPAQVALLTRRLERLAQVYEEDFGVDVRDLPGSGAAGGLAGGLAAVGATLVPGFDVVADTLDLPSRLEGCDLVLTGEGYLDEQSFAGKAVGGMAALAGGVPVVAVVGDADPDVEPPRGVRVISLVERFGLERAMADTAACITEVVADLLADW